MIEELADNIKDLQFQRERGLRMKSLMEHPGWKKDLGPELMKKRESFMNMLLNSEIKTIEHMHLIRQSIHAIDGIRLRMKNCVELGDGAVEALKKMAKQEKEQE